MQFYQTLEQMTEKMKNIGMDSFLTKVRERLEQMEAELVIDRLEGEIAICEDRKTGKRIEIAKEKLPEGIKEGSVIQEKNGQYIHATEKEQQIEERIANKMKDLWN